MPLTEVGNKGGPRLARRHRLNAFDGFVLAGALVNVAVVLLLFGYWLLH